MNKATREELAGVVHFASYKAHAETLEKYKQTDIALQVAREKLRDMQKSNDLLVERIRAYSEAVDDTRSDALDVRMQRYRDMRHAAGLVPR